MKVQACQRFSGNSEIYRLKIAILFNPFDQFFGYFVRQVAVASKEQNFFAVLLNRVIQNPLGEFINNRA
ncbi:hypothetical protein D3C76_1742040 [compost metagenome]